MFLVTSTRLVKWIPYKRSMTKSNVRMLQIYHHLHLGGKKLPSVTCNDTFFFSFYAKKENGIVVTMFVNQVRSGQLWTHDMSQLQLVRP